MKNVHHYPPAVGVSGVSGGDEAATEDIPVPPRSPPLPGVQGRPQGEAVPLLQGGAVGGERHQEHSGREHGGDYVWSCDYR